MLNFHNTLPPQAGKVSLIESAQTELTESYRDGIASVVELAGGWAASSVIEQGAAPHDALKIGTQLSAQFEDRDVAMNFHLGYYSVLQQKDYDVSEYLISMEDALASVGGEIL
jgi:hypothetical protein